MGRTVKILTKKEVPPSLCNTRFTVELCEKIHIHYRNIRLEFKKEEFLHILNLLSKIDVETIKNFPYNDYNFNLLVEDFNLPPLCEYSDRLQIEKQKEGHYHIHYRNCRLEFKRLTEIGFSNINFGLPLLQYKLTCFFSELQNKSLKLYSKKSVEKLLKSKFEFKIDKEWAKKFANNVPTYRRYSICTLSLEKLKAVLFVKEGLWSYPLNVTPPFLYLKGDKEAYHSYCTFKNTREGTDRHDDKRFEKLLDDLKNSEHLQHFIIVNRKNEILDGLHRACFLLYKYGPSYKIPVLKLYWVDKD